MFFLSLLAFRPSTVLKAEKKNIQAGGCLVLIQSLITPVPSSFKACWPDHHYKKPVLAPWWLDLTANLAQSKPPPPQHRVTLWRLLSCSFAAVMNNNRSFYEVDGLLQGCVLQCTG